MIKKIILLPFLFNCFFTTAQKGIDTSTAILEKIIAGFSKQLIIDNPGNEFEYDAVMQVYKNKELGVGISTMVLPITLSYFKTTLKDSSRSTFGNEVSVMRDSVTTTKYGKSMFIVEYEVLSPNPVLYENQIIIITILDDGNKENSYAATITYKKNKEAIWKERLLKICATLRVDN